jgi:Fe/S biogenesis protein NfuA
MPEATVSLSEEAATRILEFMETKGQQGSGVRLEVRDLAGSMYNLSFVELSERRDDDLLVESRGVTLVIDRKSAERTEGATLNYVEDLYATGFRLDNPNKPGLTGLAGRVQEAIDRDVNPMVAQHGGKIVLLDVEDGRVKIEFGGGCQGCGMVDVTLKQGVETLLREAVPEITEIIDATDHGAGETPYYQPDA